MLETGKGLLFRLMVLVALLFGAAQSQSQAQTPSATTVSALVSENQVFAGERFTFSVDIRGTSFRNVGRPQLPSTIAGFRQVSLQPSTSTNYSIVNGQASRSYVYSWTFVAESPGSFLIPAVSVEVDGERFTTNPVAITVIDRNTAASRSGSAQPDIFVRVELSDDRPVVGQQIITELVLYFKQPLEIVNYQPNNNWVTEGFWKESLSDGTNPRAESVILGGERFRRAVLLRHALFPSRAGNLTISGAKLTATVRNTSRQSDPFSSFFGGFGTNQRTVELSSEDIRVTVRPLPDAGAAKTINAVGNFTLQRRISPSRGTVGEAIEVITDIQGTGNLALVNKPMYSFPDGFEVFQPQENLNLTKSAEGVGGLRSFRDILIARRAGTFEIPAEQLVFYDPARRRYVTVNLAAQTITIQRDEREALTMVEQRRLAVVPVIGVVRWTPAQNARVLTAWWFWFGLLLPGVVVPLAWRKKMENDRLRDDHAYARRVRARETVSQRLQQARELAQSGQGETKNVITLLQATLYGAVTDRLNLPEAGHSDEDILRYVGDSSLSAESAQILEKLLRKYSTIRFAPVVARENLLHEIDKVAALTDQICEVL